MCPKKLYKLSKVTDYPGDELIVVDRTQKNLAQLSRAHCTYYSLKYILSISHIVLLAVMVLAQ